MLYQSNQFLHIIYLIHFHLNMLAHQKLRMLYIAEYVQKLNQSTFLNSPTHFKYHFETWICLPANSYKSMSIFISKFIHHYIKWYCKLIRMKRNKLLNYFNFFEWKFIPWILTFIQKWGTRKYGWSWNTTNFLLPSLAH